jgi:hypothetical protein
MDDNQFRFEIFALQATIRTLVQEVKEVKVKLDLMKVKYDQLEYNLKR